MAAEYINSRQNLIDLFETFYKKTRNEIETFLNKQNNIISIKNFLEENVDGENKNCLHFAVLGHNLDGIHYCLEKNINLLNKKDINGQTSLILSSINNFRDITELLLFQYKAAANVQTNLGLSALHFACLNKKSDVIDLLIQIEDLNVNSYAENIGTPLHAAILSNDVNNIQTLLQRKDVNLNFSENKIPPPLIMASSLLTTESENIVEILVDKGANIDVVDTEGWTALHCAVESGQYNIVKLLIQKGIKRDTVVKGKTAIDLAEENKYEEVYNYLLELKKTTSNNTT